MIEIKAFQALDGDCIWLRYGKNEIVNIVIDVGYLSSFKNTLKTVFDSCSKNNERINLLILTHTDSDHISGIKGLQENVALLNMVDKVWFNTPYIRIGDYSNDNISFREGKNVSEFFVENKVSVLNGMCNDMQNYILNDAIITILSPDENNLLKCNDIWLDKLKSDKISSPISDWSFGVEELIRRKQLKDESVTNNASIGFLFDYDDRKLMFLGDSNPKIIIEKLQAMAFNEEHPLKLDLIKLAHHGSRYNFSNDLLKYIICENYLVSSNGNNLSKETLAKIIVSNAQKNIEGTTFYFSHSQDIYSSLFSQSEIETYDIKCIFACEQANYAELRYN